MHQRSLPLPLRIATSERAKGLTTRFGRLALANALVLHALAHSAAVVSAATRIGEHGRRATALSDYAALWLASLLAAFIVSNLLAGGIGLLPNRPFRTTWRLHALVGLFGSLVFLV